MTSPAPEQAVPFGESDWEALRAAARDAMSRAYA
ncbi:cytidine deaminase, partial [Streptomyces sp. SID8455]|nr:cytidine deaminase [Streptomyces sp. SID8455]